MPPLSDAFRWLRNMTGISPDIQVKLFESVVVVLALYILSKVIRKLLFKRSENVMYRYRWNKTLGYSLFFIGAFIILQIWIKEFKSVATVLGLVSAGIAIALKDPITDLAGWFFIIWRKPFEVGDRVQIGKHAGDVVDVRIFQFTLVEIGNWVDADQSTGRVMHIPNSMLFREVLANYHIGFSYIWHEIGVLVTFESDWQKAKKILGDIVANNSEQITKDLERHIKMASKKYMIFYNKLTPIVYTDVKDSGVMLTMRFLCHPRQRRIYREKIWEAVLVAFAKEDDIDLAYPTQRFFNNLSEGKEGTKPPTNN